VQQCHLSPHSCNVLLLLQCLLAAVVAAAALSLLRQVYTPVPCPFDDMCSFHSREYLEGLKSVDAPKVGQAAGCTQCITQLAAILVTLFQCLR
jgi:hypothetical protein